MLLVPLRHVLEAAPATHFPRSVPALNAERWSTSSSVDPTSVSAPEVIDLGDHLRRCRRLRGQMFAALCLSDIVDGFLAPRIMTTIVVIAMLGAMITML